MSTKSFYKLPENIAEDIAAFEADYKKFISGEIDPVEFKASRVTRGIYEQRIAGKFMTRIRLPGGGITPTQLTKVAELQAKYGSGEIHITDRQDIQMHSVDLENVPTIMKELVSVGLSPKGGGGNTVRNITACWGSGVCKNEVFDTAPYSVGLTEYLIKDPASFTLPRKYKIAFSGCEKDCALATVNDVGFIAKTKEIDGKKVNGFRVYAAGGLGSGARPSDLLEEFILPEDVPYYAEAMKRLFDKHGNRKDKHKARLRFVIRRFGYEKFKSIFKEELAALKEEENITLSIRELPRLRNPKQTEKQDEQPNKQELYEEWLDAHVSKQGQNGYFMVEIPLKFGLILSEDLKNLADIISMYGEGSLRVMQNQNFMLRWVAKGELGSLFNKLEKQGFIQDNGKILANLISCPGVSTCQLGICLSRNLADEIIDRISTPECKKSLKNICIRISGCPNSCGQHPIGQIGLHGVAKKGDLENLAPYYKIALGGRVKEGKTALAEEVGMLPAKNVPGVIGEFLETYQRERQEKESYFAFLERKGNDVMKELIQKNSFIPSFKDDPSYYHDCGSTDKFSLKGRGAGECSAGVFDMIDVDLLKAEEAIILAEKIKSTGSGGSFFKAIYAASKHGAHCLLITQALAPKSDKETFEFFTKNFIDAGYVDQEIKSLLVAKEEDVDNSQEKYLELSKKLLDTIRVLHASMDDSLKFNIPKKNK